MRLQWLRLEFRMELAAEEIRMVRNFHDLHIGSVRGAAGKAHARAGEYGLILAVEFIAVAMALADLGCSVSVGSVAVRFQLASPGSQSHGAAQFVNAAQFTQFVNHTMRGCRIKLAGICLLQSADVACVLNACRLHAQADAEIRYLLLARIADRIQHAFNAALAESAGD